MSEINTGGAAFPKAHDSNSKETNGMTLRQYFAAHAAVSTYTPIESFELSRKRKPTIGELAEYIVQIRLVEADAMIAALEGGAK